MSRWLLILAANFALVQPAWAELEITDVRARYGPRGPERKSLEMVPGDQIHFTFRVQGLKLDADGKVDLAMEMEIRDPAGLVMTQKIPSRDVLTLGGGTLSGVSNLNLNPQAIAGEYTLKVTVVDNLAKESVSFERTVTCKKLEFAITQLGFYLDKEGKLPGSNTAIVSQPLHVRLLAAGFDRAQPKLKIIMLVQTLDKEGRELMPKPLRVEAATEDANAIAKIPGVSFNAFLIPNRAGEFSLRITLIDDVSERKTELTVPLRILPH